MILCLSYAQAGRVLSTSKEATIAFVNGKEDLAIEVTICVQNVGDAGDITIKVILRCSEGTFTCQQAIYFKANEIKNARFVIHEPTMSLYC